MLAWTAAVHTAHGTEAYLLHSAATPFTRTAAVLTAQVPNLLYGAATMFAWTAVIYTAQRQLVCTEHFFPAWTAVVHAAQGTTLMH